LYATISSGDFFATLFFCLPPVAAFGRNQDGRNHESANEQAAGNNRSARSARSQCHATPYGGRAQMAQFARHNLLCGFAALRELILQTVHDSRDFVFDQNVSRTVAPEKKGLTPSRKGAKKKKRSAESRSPGIRKYPNSSGIYTNTVDP